MINKLFKRLILVVLSITIAGCTTHTIRGGGPKTTSAITGTETIHGSLYSFSGPDIPENKCALGYDLVQVRYHTNAFYLIVSVISLGIYVPENIEWWCGKRPTDEGEESWKPGSDSSSDSSEEGGETNG